MLKQLAEWWSEVPPWLRAVIGLQIAAAGWIMHTLAHRLAAGSDGPAGFTIGLGLAVVGLTARGVLRGGETADSDGE